VEALAIGREFGFHVLDVGPALRSEMSANGIERCRARVAALETSEVRAGTTAERSVPGVLVKRRRYV